MARLSNIALIIAVKIFVLMCILAEEERYTDEYDNFDFSCLSNKTVRELYYKCFMEIAPCETAEQATLTRMFGDAYQTKCKKCTEKQKEMFSAVIDWYIKNAPDKWQTIIKKIEEDKEKKAAQQYILLRRH